MHIKSKLIELITLKMGKNYQFLVFHCFLFPLATFLQPCSRYLNSPLGWIISPPLGCCCCWCHLEYFIIAYLLWPQLVVISLNHSIAYVSCPGRTFEAQQHVSAKWALHRWILSQEYRCLRLSILSVWIIQEN